MKKLFLAGSIVFISIGFTNAQNLDDIKTQILLRQFKAAKPVIDKAATNEKLAKKPETWILKTNIYTALALDSVNKAQSESLLAEANSAFTKYKELDPTFALMKDNTLTSGPVNLYTNSFKKGVEGFNNQDYQAGFKNFVDAIGYSEFLIKTKITNMAMDTTSILYAGASAQKLKDDEGAKTYFTRLADAKVTSKDYEFLYQYLSNYYLEKKDDANFAKYIALGKSYYPDSKYFPAVEQEYANSKDIYHLSLREGDEMFLKLYPKDEADAPKGDISAFEDKLVAAYTKASEVKPEKAGLAYTNIGNHYINKSVAINKQIVAVSDGMKALAKNAKPDKTGKMPPASKDSLAKRDKLFKDYDASADQAIVYYEKAANAFAKQGTLEQIEKQSYKNSVSYLIDLYAEKKTNAQRLKQTADATKYEAQEKKWNGIYSSIK